MHHNSNPINIVYYSNLTFKRQHLYLKITCTWCKRNQNQLKKQPTKTSVMRLFSNFIQIHAHAVVPYSQFQEHVFAEPCSWFYYFILSCNCTCFCCALFMVLSSTCTYFCCAVFVSNACTSISVIMFSSCFNFISKNFNFERNFLATARIETNEHIFKK